MSTSVLGNCSDLLFWLLGLFPHTEQFKLRDVARGLLLETVVYGCSAA